jgi:hypothetical protein
MTEAVAQTHGMLRCMSGNAMSVSSLGLRLRGISLACVKWAQRALSVAEARLEAPPTNLLDAGLSEQQLRVASESVRLSPVWKRD